MNFHTKHCYLAADKASQRDRLQHLIETRQLECLVCCDKVRHTDDVWSCKQCYHILHLNCVTTWAETSKLENGWRCPACQNVYEDVPKKSLCYCGKVSKPRIELGTLPHSCGDVCGRKSRLCNHACTLLCHPGPCPDCDIFIERSCGCGSVKSTIKCSSDVTISCRKPCNKLLNCKMHTCANICHENECNDCDVILKQECYCGKVGRKVRCTIEVNQNEMYQCGDTCDKLLSCGNHNCTSVCHPGECPPCPMSPTLIQKCPCGQTELTEKRNTCLDPIPCCEKVRYKINEH